MNARNIIQDQSGSVLICSSCHRGVWLDDLDDPESWDHCCETPAAHVAGMLTFLAAYLIVLALGVAACLWSTI